MRRTHEERAARERAEARLFLCGMAFFCYSATLASLVSLGYALCVLALAAAGHASAAAGFPFETAAP
jgi:nicotinamidase-related amidase